MEFGLTSEQEALRTSTVDFAQSLKTMDLVHRDAAQVFDRELWQQTAGFGLLGPFVSPDYGGRGLDLVSSVIMLEALGYGCADNGHTLAVNAQLWAVHAPLVRFGSDEQKQRYLPGLVAGTLLGADGITEIDAGSDAYSMKTIAEETTGGYRITGHKSYITMAPMADFVIVFATTDPSLGRWGIDAFLVDTDSPGLVLGENRAKMGLRTVPFGDIVLEDVFVTEDARLGPKGAGASIFNHVMNYERGFIFASHVGAMQRQLEAAISYASTREQFGEPIASFQSVSNRIVDMQMRLETSRLLLYRAAWLMDTGQDAQMAAALAKLQISEAFVTSSIDSIRTHGGIGYLTEAGVERDLRDAIGGVLYGGTSDIQRRSIAHILGL
ncbi:MAG: acyl-CoA dehydrogenase family protein [Acidimicrobiia bacterium]|nr:acyl-CoA dehydrogenase family protein [Acidimicrobiia bacterium]NNF70235.1 acyl-CoA dehydrogenase [Acidimicrobiia bacterium]